MKVNNINNSYSLNKNNNLNKSKGNSPSFGGVMAIRFWDAVARGGFAASFTIQDMTGTNFPRTYQALQRNKDITGENNYKAAAEVAIREFMTGPSMCLIPALVLMASQKVAGGAMSVPVENIEAFSDQMKTILQKKELLTSVNNPVEYMARYSKEAKYAFYERMFALTLGENVQNGAPASASAKELAKMLVRYDEAPKRNFIKQLLNKDMVKRGQNGLPDVKITAKDQIFSELITKYTDAKKQVTGDYTTLLTSDVNGILKKPKKITSLMKDMSAFANDVEKNLKGCASEGSLIPPGIKFNSFMDNYKKLKVGSKFITNILMVAATALFMIKIPKLYTLHKTNPETDAFRASSNDEDRKGAK